MTKKLTFGPFIPKPGQVDENGDIIRPAETGQWELPLLDGNAFAGTPDGSCGYWKESGSSGDCIQHGPRFGHGSLDGDIVLWWQDGKHWIGVKTRTMWLYKSAQYRQLFRLEDFPCAAPRDWLNVDRQRVLDLAYAAARTRPGTPENEAAVMRLFRLAARGGWGADEANNYVCHAIAAALKGDVRKLARRLKLSREDSIAVARHWVNYDPSPSGRAVWREILDAATAEAAAQEPAPAN